MARDHLPPDTKSRIRADVESISARVQSRQELSFETAKLLFFQYGLHPSVQLVYEFTQRGSMGDLSTDMRAFWAWLRTSTQERLSVPGMPATLVGRQGELLSEIWRLAHEKALEALAEQRQAIDAKLVEASKETEAARAARLLADEGRVRAEQDAVQAKQDADSARAALEATERTVAVERSQKAAALESADRWHKAADNEKLERERAQAQFSRDLASEREGREKEIAWAKGQIEEARALTRQSQARVKELESNKRANELAHNKAVNDLQSLLNARTQEALATAAALREQHGIQIQQLQERLNKQALEIGELRGRVSSLSDERDRANADLRAERERAAARAQQVPRRRPRP